MYQSNLEDRKRQAVLSPQDDIDMDETAKLHNRFLNKERGPIKSNGNISHKRGAVSFNIGRIMPRNITHDKQFLYQQNIKLKESVQQFREEVVKLRTRLSVSEKQKIKIADEFNNSDFPNKNSSSRINKRHGSMTYSNIQNQNYLKKMLRQTKDQVNLLKNQNTRLKKTVKYTQISQLQIQNKYLLEQCQRLNNIIESKVLDQNQYIDDYERKISQLKQQLQHEKDNTRSVTNETRKKNEQIQSLKNQVMELNLREKKLKRQLNDYKKTPSSNNKRESFSNNNNIKNGQIKAFRVNEEQTKKLKTKQKQPEPSIHRKNESMSKNSNLHHEQVKSVKNQEKKSSIVKIDTENDTNKHSKNPKQIESSHKKEIQVDDEDYNDQFQGKQNDNSKQNEDYGQDNFDNQSQTNQKDKNHKQKQAEKDQYQDQFDDVQDDKSSKQQVLFNKSSGGKQEDMKDTITYRLMSQRYTYKDLQSDIKQSGMQEFTLEQIASMLSDEPFFLTEEQIQWLLSFIFQRDDLHLEDKVKTKEFVTKIKSFIGDFTLLSEQKEQEYMQNCIQFLQKNKKQLKKKFKQQSDPNKNISKNTFIQILKGYKLKKDEIDVLLGQASLVSLTTNQINYNEFLNKLAR